MSNSLKNETIKVEIEKKKKNKQEAVANAFRYLSKNVSERIGDEIMVYMKPADVNILDIDINEHTERFLFIFLPRKKQEVRVKLLITVDVQTLTI